MFNERKAAQVAAYFLALAPNKRMPHLKLMKLMYLSDREAVRAYGWQITEDRLVSMPHGPVLSQTLNLMDGDTESRPGGWDDWVTDKENHELSLRGSCDPADLDELAPVEVDVLKAIWSRFGQMGKWEIRDWTHKNCAEWKDPHGSSNPISYDALARAVGYDAEAAAEVALQIHEAQQVDRFFAAL